MKLRALFYMALAMLALAATIVLLLLLASAFAPDACPKGNYCPDESGCQYGC